eukprot:GHVS01054044.1.p1 GENE.GHVS01054044.1~~GHVS01054044.1.p1  ORF type:complete len:340 (-),score=32.12 GHVS01054044.1:3-1022(-)
MTRKAQTSSSQESERGVAVGGGVMAGGQASLIGAAEADIWKQQFKHMLGGPYPNVHSDRRKIYYIGGISSLLIISLVAVSVYFWVAATEGQVTSTGQKDASASMLAVLPLEELLDFRTARLPVSAEDTRDFDIFSITRIGQDSEQITIADLSDHHTLTIKDGGICTLFSESNGPLYQWAASLSDEEINRPLAGLSSPGSRRLLGKLSKSRFGHSSKSFARHTPHNGLRTYMNNLPQAMGAAMYPYGINPFNVPGYDNGPILGDNPGPPIGPHPFTVDLLRNGWPGPPASQFYAAETPPGRRDSTPERLGLSGGMGGDGRSPGRGWRPTNDFDIIPVMGS